MPGCWEVAREGRVRVEERAGALRGLEGELRYRSYEDVDELLLRGAVDALIQAERFAGEVLRAMSFSDRIAAGG